MGAKSSLTMSWCTDQATVNLSKLRTLYDETREGLTGRFPKCTLAERVHIVTNIRASSPSSLYSSPYSF